MKHEISCTTPNCRLRQKIVFERTNIQINLTQYFVCTPCPLHIKYYYGYKEYITEIISYENKMFIHYKFEFN